MEYIIAAFAFGISAGLTPGPFMMIVLSESLKGGWKRGATAALAPFFTDGVMILVSLLILRNLPAPVFGVIEALGGLMMIYFAYGNFKVLKESPIIKNYDNVPHVTSNRLAPLLRGISVNVLNPAPWMFWFTAGGSVLRNTLSDSEVLAIAFIVIFFSILVGSKILLAFVSGQRLLSGRVYQLLLFISGGALLLLGFRAIYNAGSFFMQ